MMEDYRSQIASGVGYAGKVPGDSSPTRIDLSAAKDKRIAELEAENARLQKERGECWTAFGERMERIEELKAKVTETWKLYGFIFAKNRRLREELVVAYRELVRLETEIKPWMDTDPCADEYEKRILELEGRYADKTEA